MECQSLTCAAVAEPPKMMFCSTTQTDAPRRAARTAANTPVQLPPMTQRSHSCATAMRRAGSSMKATTPGASDDDGTAGGKFAPELGDIDRAHVVCRPHGDHAR